MTIKDEIDVLMEGINPPEGFKNMIIQTAYFDKARNGQEKEKNGKIELKNWKKVKKKKKKS